MAVEELGKSVAVLMLAMMPQGMHAQAPVREQALLNAAVAQLGGIGRGQIPESLTGMLVGLLPHIPVAATAAACRTDECGSVLYRPRHQQPTGIAAPKSVNVNPAAGIAD